MIIITTQRSGGTALFTNLKGDIETPAYEPFNSEKERKLSIVFTKEYKERFQFPEEYIGLILRDHGVIKICMEFVPPDCLRKIIEKYKDIILVLKRDVVDQYVSLKKSTESGIWINFKNGDKIKTKSASFTETIEDYRDRMSKYYNLVPDFPTVKYGSQAYRVLTINAKTK